MRTGEYCVISILSTMVDDRYARSTRSIAALFAYLTHGLGWLREDFRLRFVHQRVGTYVE